MLYKREKGGKDFAWIRYVTVKLILIKENTNIWLTFQVRKHRFNKIISRLIFSHNLWMGSIQEQIRGPIQEFRNSAPSGSNWDLHLSDTQWPPEGERERGLLKQQLSYRYQGLRDRDPSISTYLADQILIPWCASLLIVPD